MKRDAERLVEQERKQVARTISSRRRSNLAVREAAQILEKRVTADDHARLAQELLAELARRPRPVAVSSAPRTGGAS